MNREDQEFTETLELLREAHRAAIPEAHFTAVRARVLSQLAAERRPWRRGFWPYGFVAAAVAAMLLAALVGRTPWSARVPLDPPFARPSRSHALAGPTRASAADQGVRPTSAVGRRKRLPHNAAPAAYRVIGPPDPRPLVVKLLTDDPNIVIYWIASIKGE
jgi:hypothetical protein